MYTAQQRNRRLCREFIVHAQARLAESALQGATARAQQAEQAVTAAKCASLHTRLEEQREDRAERGARAAAEHAALLEVRGNEHAWLRARNVRPWREAATAGGCVGDSILQTKKACLQGMEPMAAGLCQSWFEHGRATCLPSCHGVEQEVLSKTAPFMILAQYVIPSLWRCRLSVGKQRPNKPWCTSSGPEPRPESQHSGGHFWLCASRPGVRCCWEAIVPCAAVRATPTVCAPPSVKDQGMCPCKHNLESPASKGA